MNPETVQALRDVKALFDEGILSEAEYTQKKGELLNPPPAVPVPSPPPPTTKAKAKTELPEQPATKKKKKAGGPQLSIQDCGTAGVCVSGPGTFKARGALAKLDGSWSKSQRAWVFAAGSFEKVKTGLEADYDVEVQAPTSAEKKKASLDEQKRLAMDLRVDEDTDVDIVNHKRAILVKGTHLKPINDKLKALGGTWNKGLRGWVFPASRASEVVAGLAEDPKLNLNIEDPNLRKVKITHTQDNNKHTVPIGSQDTEDNGPDDDDDDDDRKEEEERKPEPPAAPAAPAAPVVVVKRDTEDDDDDAGPSRPAAARDDDHHHLEDTNLQDKTKSTVKKTKVGYWTDTSGPSPSSAGSKKLSA